MRCRRGARLFREPRGGRGAARPRAACEAASDEPHVRTLDDGPQFVRGLAGRLLADLGECTGSEAARDAASQEELVGGPDDEQMLGVRVRGEQLRPDDAGFDEAVDRVAAAAPDPDNLDIRPEAREDPLEFGVFRVDGYPLRGGLREPRLNARATYDWTTSATRSASEIVMSFPPVTLIRTPWAVETSTSRSGELMASSIASTARLSPTAWLSPRPIIATPPPFMIVFTSLKSRFTRPGFVMISVSPLIDRIRTSSANLNARFSDCRGTRSSNLSFGIVMTVSAAS